MCNNACNCATNFERLSGEIESMKNLLISIHVMITHHLMKKENVLEENHHVNNLERQGVESSMNHNIPVITPLERRKFIDETFETMMKCFPLQEWNFLQLWRICVLLNHTLVTG